MYIDGHGVELADDGSECAVVADGASRDGANPLRLN